MVIYDLAIVGGGPAGIMAGIAAQADRARDRPARQQPKLQAMAGGDRVKVCLLERNKSLGVKLLLTGKGRCNLTTSKTVLEIVKAFGPKGGFFHSALARFSNKDLINFFEGRGLVLKIERGQRVFPADDKAGSVLNILRNELFKSSAEVIFNFRVLKIKKEGNFFKIFGNNEQILLAKKIILATGGKSYPETGSTGDGYQFAKSFGHKISPLKPALAPLFVKNERIRGLAGLDLDNVDLTVLADKEPVATFFGDLLFTHQGISGPVVLELATKIYDLLQEKKEVFVSIDLKPSLDKEKLKLRINRDILQLAKKEYQTLLAGLLPKSLIPYFMEETKINEHRKNGSLSKEEKERLANLLKNFTFKIDGVAPIEQGIVTAGGVEVDEINQRTMESKIVPGLYFAGEIIGLTGPTGGFNLTKAFSTGWLAGKSALAGLD